MTSNSAGNWKEKLELQLGLLQLPFMSLDPDGNWGWFDAPLHLELSLTSWLWLLAFERLGDVLVLDVMEWLWFA